MASRVQQQSLWRKIAYFALVVLLLFAALGVRKMTDAQAVGLQIREQDLGEVELTDKAIRLTLTGSRGIAVCGLWYAANEKQKKHEWNELELLVRSLIKLQPHFVSPWLFQSWNLAYNVSVECDRVKDKYFYISRGISLLAQGDRINRDNCDMRHFVGFYIQNKMGSSDERNTLRTLFQLSCVNPSERRPEKFRQLVDNRTVIDWNAFEEFCRRHPHVVRRIRDKLPGMKTPDDIIDFLASGQKIPSLYEDTPQSEESERESAPTLRPLDDRFPILPPRQQFDPNELTYEASELGDDFDNFSAARAWFGYAQDPVVITKVRRPKYMSQVIFESQPPRAQGYFAEFQESEGWFDREGWEIKDWFPRDKYHPESAKRSVVVGDGVNWAGDAWEKAYQMYNDFGVRRGLYKTAEELQAMTEPERSEYEYNRSLTNFAHFYAESDVERTKEAVAARKYFYLAEQLRRSGDRQLALEMYERPEAFPMWKKIMLTHRDFRRDLEIQEGTYIMQRKYLSLVRDKRAPLVKRLLLWQDFMTQATMGPTSPRLWLPIHLVQSVRVPLEGPFNDVDDQGEPLISEMAISRAIGSNNLSREPTGLFTTTPGAPAPSPQGKTTAR
jgi:hypothetical protein